MQNQKCFVVSNFNQLDQLIKIRSNHFKTTTVFIKNFLVKGFGIEWIKTYISQINIKYKKHTIKYYVDCGYDYGLCILLIEEKVDYIKLKSDLEILSNLENLAKKNKVLLNGKFDVIDLRKIKKIESKVL